MSALIPYQDLEQALGFPLCEGTTRMVSPDSAHLRVQTDISLRHGRLEIGTHAHHGEKPSTPMMKLVLVADDNGWRIEEQAHSGLPVQADAALALAALEQNLCATPFPASPTRKTHRP